MILCQRVQAIYIWHAWHRSCLLNIMTRCQRKWNLLKEKWGLGWVGEGVGGGVKGNNKGGVKRGMVTGAMRWAWTLWSQASHTRTAVCKRINIKHTIAVVTQRQAHYTASVSCEWCPSPLTTALCPALVGTSPSATGCPRMPITFTLLLGKPPKQTCSSTSPTLIS